MMEIKERLIKLEVDARHTSEFVDEIKAGLGELNEKVGKIDTKMEKATSFFGGVAFTFSLLGALFVFIAKYLLSKMGIEV